jgi:hypothetical protein
MTTLRQDDMPVICEGTAEVSKMTFVAVDVDSWPIPKQL